MIYIIDDDEIMVDCLARACRGFEVQKFSNAIEAMNQIADFGAPDLIFLDILLDGPDGFAFLNELVSYVDTAKIPVVVVSSLDFVGKDLSAYGVVGVLDKTTMTPKEIKEYVQKYGS
ncbi:MAG: response regulator [Candidatus Saccharibacteria bacterium]|nr:response regulator [Candidatus Saccharibacteria bacterium]